MVESVKGVWAPDLHFDEPRKTFIITSTRMARMRGHYVDPSLFQDTDGTYYVVSLQWEWREGYEVPGTIVLQQYDGIQEKRLNMYRPYQPVQLIVDA